MKMPDKKYICIIVLFGVIAFLPSLWGGFIFDDLPLMKSSVILDSSPSKVLTTGVLNILDAKYQGYWRPLGLFSIWLEHKIFGLHSFFFKLDSLIIHIFTAILIYFTILLLLRKNNFDEKSQKIISFFTALLFVVHTSHTEAIAMVSGRYDLMAAFFTILTFYLFIRWLYDENKSVYWLIASSLAFFLALISKESASPLPILLLFLYIFPKIPRKKLAIGILTILVVAIFIYFPLRLHFMPGETHLIRAGDKFYGALFNIPHIISRYIQIMLFPFRPNPLYHIDIFTISLDFRTAISWIITIPFIIVLIYFLIKRKIEGFGLAWFFVFLLPAIGIFETVGSYIAERYLSIPSIGFLLTVVVLVVHRYFHKRISYLLLWVFAIALCSTSFIYTETVWTSQMKLGNYIVKHSPRRSTGYMMCAIEAISADNPVKAIEYLRKHAVSIGTKYKDFCKISAVVHSMLGDTDSAMYYYKLGISVDENDPQFHNNLGFIFFKQDEMDSALFHFKRSLEITPNYPYALRNLILFYLAEGDTAIAKKYYKKFRSIVGKDSTFENILYENNSFSQ